MTTFKDFGVQMEKAVLSNGVNVLLLKREGMPIYSTVVFASGSMYDPKGKEGISHFVEHMLTAGTKGFPSKEKLATHIEQLGGIFGATTFSDFVSINVEIADKSDFKEGVLILREMLTKSLFKEKTIEMERKSILKEMGDRLASPSLYLWDLSKSLLFQETPYGKFSIGSAESVGSISKNDLLSFHAKMFTKERAAVIISGDISLDQVISGLEKNLPLNTSEKYDSTKPFATIANKKVMVEKYPKQKQVNLVIGFRTVPIGHPDMVPLDILKTISGGGRASVLSSKLRYEKGLVYTVRAFSPNFLNGGMWVVKTSTVKDDLQEVIDIIVEEFKRISLGKVTKEQLEFAQDKIIKSKKREMQTSRSWVQEHLYNQFESNSMQLPDYLNTVQNTTLKDLHEVGKKYFKQNSCYLALCGDIDEDSATVNF